MIISAKPVFNPRRAHKCHKCKQPISGPHLRLYGRADEGEDRKPFEIRLHPICVPARRLDTDVLILAALERLQQHAQAQNGGDYGA